MDNDAISFPRVKVSTHENGTVYVSQELTDCRTGELLC
jgi:hypothetical protein